MKKQTIENLVNELRDAADIGFLPLNDDIMKNITHSCKKLLTFVGYKIVEPVGKRYNVKDINGLIDLFYAYLDYKHPELIATHRNIKKDRALAKRFVDARMEAGNINKQQALNECAQIIQTIFEREPEFNFTIPLSFEMLGQDAAGWITKKAVEFLNAEQQEYKKKLTEKMQDDIIAKVLKERGEETIRFDVDALLEKMEKENK
jgi:hypothetical protein